MSDARPARNINRNMSQKTKASQSQRMCPICKGHVAASSATFPFCSKRCRLVDLGQWFSESYAVSRALEPEDESELDD